jgi:hypothetical protein
MVFTFGVTSHKTSASWESFYKWFTLAWVARVHGVTTLNPKHVIAHKLKNFEDLNVTQKIIKKEKEKS